MCAASGASSLAFRLLFRVTQCRAPPPLAALLRLPLASTRRVRRRRHSALRRPSRTVLVSRFRARSMFGARRWRGAFAGAERGQYPRPAAAGRGGPVAARFTRAPHLVGGGVFRCASAFTIGCAWPSSRSCGGAREVARLLARDVRETRRALAWRWMHLRARVSATRGAGGVRRLQCCVGAGAIARDSVAAARSLQQ